ncbi:MAG: efflux RND transporter periplasmic adaptor subunit [Candidatus Acidiferrales bacterium]
MKQIQRILIITPLLAFAASGVMTSGCGSESNAPAPGANPQASNAPTDVDVVKVATQKLDTVVTLPGELTPYEMVAIYPKVTGYVKWISVDRGSRVKQDEEIAQLEAPELVAQRAEAESKLQAAQMQLGVAQAKFAADQGTYERLSAAAKTPGVVAGNDLQIASKAADADRAGVAALEGGVAAARSARDSVAQIENYLRITAPFDGIVTERNVHPGALVGPASGAQSGTQASSPMVRIEMLGRLRLVVPVPETDVANVPQGAQIKFTVPAFPTETFQAPVARVSHAIDEKTRTMPVELEVSNAAGKLTPGSFCQVQWPVRRATPSNFVPQSAIATNQERTFVIRIPLAGANAGKAEWVDVKAGASITTASGTLVEVFGDLKDSDQVVLRATDAIRPGTPLKFRQPTGGKS